MSKLDHILVDYDGDVSAWTKDDVTLGFHYKSNITKASIERIQHLIYNYPSYTCLFINTTLPLVSIYHRPTKGGAQ